LIQKRTWCLLLILPSRYASARSPTPLPHRRSTSSTWSAAPWGARAPHVDCKESRGWSTKSEVSTKKNLSIAQSKQESQCMQRCVTSSFGHHVKGRMQRGSSLSPLTHRQKKKAQPSHTAASCGGAASNPWIRQRS